MTICTPEEKSLAVLIMMDTEGSEIHMEKTWWCFVDKSRG
uniref:Uncharacterized protein n=1 Tax=Vitis vinifera TaxID=29760 RepID=F6I1Q6_VITVI